MLTVKNLYPKLNEKEQQQAAYNIDAYIKLVIEIWENQKHDSKKEKNKNHYENKKIKK